MKLSLFPLVVFTSVFAVSASFGEPANLLPEGSFEIFDGEGNPEGWNLPDRNWSKNFGGVVSIENEEGDNFLRLVCGIPEKLFVAIASVDLPADTYRVRIAYRVRAEVVDVGPNTDNTGTGVTVIRWWGNNESSQAKFGGADWIRENTSGWQDKEFELDVPAGMTKLTLQLGTKSTQATVDFNDVVVEVLE